MAMRFFRDRGDDLLATVERTVRQMLDDDRHSFDAATSALLAGADAAVIGPDLRATDRRVNEAERSVRRELVVHASVSGPEQMPAMLTYMSIVKDVERIGDYAKNIYDIAEAGIDLRGAPDHADLLAIRDRVSLMISEVASTLSDREEERAWELTREADQMLDGFDDRITELLRSDRPSSEGVPRALFFRYTKRIVAHLTNVLSAVIMPVDQLDYFDEDRADRPERG